MNNIKVLRLKIYQPHAHYRVPFTFRKRHTYPIPPYSTVIGLICNVLGIRDQSDENFKKLKSGLSLAIYGNFESITKEYVWFRNLQKEYHVEKFGIIENRKDQELPEHPGGQMPTRIDVLENVRLVVYIALSDEEFLETLKNAFIEPTKRVYPLHLGRAEDLIVFDGKKDEAVKIIKIDTSKKKPFYGRFEFYTWIPDPEQGEIFIDKKLYNEFYQRVKGSSHLITSFYELKNGVREFVRISVKLFEQGDFPFYFGKPFEFVKDEELDIPLFLCRMTPKEL